MEAWNAMPVLFASSTRQKPKQVKSDVKTQSIEHARDWPTTQCPHQSNGRDEGAESSSQVGSPRLRRQAVSLTPEISPGEEHNGEGMREEKKARGSEI